MPEIWLLVIGAAFGTYVWRGLGVALSGRINVESGLFSWIACVAYAMVAGLISRMLLMPTGLLTETVLFDRLAACALALAVYRLSRRNLLFGVGAGVLAMMAMVWARAA